jgi:hypothetical protein
MALNNYARLPVFYNGVYLKQLTSVGMTTNSGIQRVDLLNEGLGGFTPGSGDVSVALGFAIPIGGTEVEYQQDAANENFVTLQIGVGKKSYIGTGKIETVELSQSVSANAEGSCNWVGELKPLE